MMRLPDLSITQLRHFVWVAELHSFKAAAERANRSQPALSLSIREMEERLGQPLFDRSRRGIPTPFGQQCLPLARQLLEQHDRFVGAIARLATNQGGNVRIASVATASISLLAEAMTRYTKRAPGVAVQLMDDNTPGIQAMVLEGTIDFGLCGEGSGDRRLQFEVLMRDRVGLICRPDHPLARRRTVTWTELAGLPLIATVVNDPLIRHYPQAAALDGQRLFVAHLGTLLNLIEAGVGLAVLPELSMKIAEKRLRFVPLVRPAAYRSLGILRLKGQQLSPAADAMRALLIEMAGQGRRG
ncbi:MAG: LysR family transcriptional regulator [Burkholderiaceae bacterium]